MSREHASPEAATRRKFARQKLLRTNGLAKRRARDSNPQPLAGHHISSCSARLSANVQSRPKPYTVAELGRWPKSAHIRDCLRPSAGLATNWLHVPDASLSARSRSDISSAQASCHKSQRRAKIGRSATAECPQWCRACRQVAFTPQVRPLKRHTAWLPRHRVAREYDPLCLLPPKPLPLPTAYWALLSHRRTSWLVQAWILAILELRAARGWSVETAFFSTAALPGGRSPGICSPAPAGGRPAQCLWSPSATRREKRWHAGFRQTAYRGQAIHKAKSKPRTLVVDKGRQFWCRGFKSWSRRHDIRPRFGAVGRRGSIALWSD
jgi:hypothetical protein